MQHLEADGILGLTSHAKENHLDLSGESLQSWKDQRYREWDANRETESDNASYSVGSHSDRTILGLPLTGPLKIEDVKNAFRLSALKWHPDKHQGASQAAAGERFKLCVDAYKSLCDALA
ncbi:CHAPERONE DNAJ-DOMAIN SUPERFAMILY PROTEIN [Salix koriyanagi]|uniref:CHAPERONE DNAJ-DOMAIN SUPERFAMILY PROTEIN n=1 Tax=Salix koriyanagi TaxID=2511006 RepID=A0A9Q1A7R9_9ROSI|nr:CHAPERONE DNAJ-DOMAIN SUPERFAMILY PROTEIN [Salix koriyanagi]KAJ6761506.1 CHAPERONE DNAJ-DOMAIN SUPERFAMILY PROTEIN [Salix koriyanagi]